jgi:Protein of unknown function (DUF2867)
MDNLELQFYEISLKAHDFLEGVPLHSLDFIDLKGGHKGMLMDEIYHISKLNQFKDFKAGFITDTLFKMRTFLGKILGWDEDSQLKEKTSWISRITAEEQAKSLIPTGTTESISTILYCFNNEILFEIINRTVHCFWVMATIERSDGYELYLAVYVRKLNWRTQIYMTLISPLLKWIIYPAMKKSVVENWKKAFATKELTAKVTV